MVRLENADRSFDLEYWERLGPDARLAAVLELTQEAYGVDSEDQLRLDRSVAFFRPLRG
jgi:hypothetical protein